MDIENEVRRLMGRAKGDNDNSSREDKGSRSSNYVFNGPVTINVNISNGCNNQKKMAWNSV